MTDNFFHFNFRNETSLVSLKVVNESGKKIREAVFGNKYFLRADLSKPDGRHIFFTLVILLDILL